MDKQRKHKKRKNQREESQESAEEEPKVWFRFVLIVCRRQTATNARRQSSLIVTLVRKIRQLRKRQLKNKKKKKKKKKKKRKKRLEIQSRQRRSRRSPRRLSWNHIASLKNSIHRRLLCQSLVVARQSQLRHLESLALLPRKLKTRTSISTPPKKSLLLLLLLGKDAVAAGKALLFLLPKRMNRQRSTHKKLV